MRLEEAIPKLIEIENIPFSELYDSKELVGIKIAKGNTGKLLEKLLGLPPGSSLRDFDNGELKTNKSLSNATPLETMFITQISKKIDYLLNNESFNNSWLYKKIKHLLYVPVVKESSDPNNWYFLPHYHIQIKEWDAIYRILENDYGTICEKLVTDIENSIDGFIHTSSGEFIQIRSKDAKPYNPIFSSTYNRYVSNKNHAFYFKKDFMRYIQSVEGKND